MSGPSSISMFRLRQRHGLHSTRQRQTRCQDDTVVTPEATEPQQLERKLLYGTPFQRRHRNGKPCYLQIASPWSYGKTTHPIPTRGSYNPQAHSRLQPKFGVTPTELLTIIPTEAFVQRLLLFTNGVLLTWRVCCANLGGACCAHFAFPSVSAFLMGSWDRRSPRSSPFLESA